jgi:hypothetical protein
MTGENNVDIENLLAEEHAKTKPPRRLPALAALAREFRAFGEDRYRLTIPDTGITLEIDRLRRERNELVV